MISNGLSRASIALNWVFLPLCILFFAALAYDHSKLITYPISLDRSEAAMLVTTATIAEGENPFSFQNQPARASVYPVLYNIIVAPLSVKFGNTLLLHRIVAGLLILAACALLFSVTKKAGGSSRNSLAAAALLYAGLLFYSTPIASPNSTGIVMFFLSLFVPWYYGFSNRSLLVAIVLGILAFHGKQYFIASLGYIALYLFLAISKKRALVFGVVSLLIFSSSIAIVNCTSPYFLDNTFFAVRAATGFSASDSVLYRQLVEYSQINLPILIVVALLVFVSVKEQFAQPQSSGQMAHKRRLFSLRDFDSPLFNRNIDYIWFCLACSLVVIINVADNKGNYLTYLFQFLSPFLLAGTLIGLSRLGKLTWVGQLLVLVAFYNSYNMLERDYWVDEKNWAELQEQISSGKEIYGSTLSLVEILKNGGEVYQNGHSQYTRFAIWKPPFLKRDNFEESAEGVWKNYMIEIYAMIEAQEFDLIILDERTKLPKSQSPATSHLKGRAVLKKHYRRRVVIPLSLARRRGGGKLNVEIWEPIPKTTARKAPE